MPRFFNLLRYLLIQFCISTTVMWITPTLWDWSLSWGASLFSFFFQWMDLVLSASYLVSVLRVPSIQPQ